MAEHCADVLGERASDASIVARAAETGAVIVSKDGDFIALIEERADALQLLHVRIGNAVNRVLIARLEGAWARIEAELVAGKGIVEAD